MSEANDHAHGVRHAPRHQQRDDSPQITATSHAGPQRRRPQSTTPPPTTTLPLPSSRDVGGTDLPRCHQPRCRRLGRDRGRGGRRCVKQRGWGHRRWRIVQPTCSSGGGDESPESERGSVKPTCCLVQLCSFVPAFQTAPKPNEVA
jgi:hypothetical protein